MNPEQKCTYTSTLSPDCFRWFWKLWITFSECFFISSVFKILAFLHYLRMATMFWESYGILIMVKIWLKDIPTSHISHKCGFCGSVDHPNIALTSSVVEILGNNIYQAKWTWFGCSRWLLSVFSFGQTQRQTFEMIYVQIMFIWKAAAREACLNVLWFCASPGFP